MQGEVIENALVNVLREMREQHEKADPVTLFLTATALDGDPQTYVDSYEGRFDVADHRRVYRFQNDRQHLSYERGPSGGWQVVKAPRTDFSGDIGQADSALVRAARATAAFPLAFSAVDEEPCGPAGRGATPCRVVV